LYREYRFRIDFIEQNHYNKAMKAAIIFHFTGEKLSPDTIRVGELAALLEAIEDSLSAVVIAQHPTLTKENLLIGLSSIKPGSIQLEFSTKLPEIVVPAFRQISQSIRSGTFSQLPPPSYPAFERITGFLRKNQAQADLIVSNGKRKTLATIPSDFEVPKSNYIEGHTTIYGTLVRVGGVEPKAEIKTVNERTIFCPFPRELASQLGGLLYQEVGVTGQAKWDSTTYQLVEFRIQGLTAYQQTSISQAFAELRELAGKYYDSVDDVTGYVKELRKG